MLSKKATVELPVGAPVIYSYLRSRYDGAAYRAACLATKGRVPKVVKVEEVRDSKIVYRVMGRDALTRLPVGAWTWTYEIEAAGQGRSLVTIKYRWGLILWLFALGTLGAQASNEIAETVLALEALHHPRE